MLTAIVEHIVSFMNSGPSLLPWGLVWLAVATVPVTLLHEIGHALAARDRLDEHVDVTVGNAGKITELQLGQIAVSINALSRPDRLGGSAEFDAARASARDVLYIALAGPLASLAGTVLTAVVLAWMPPGTALHHLFWALTLGGVFGTLNVIPLRFQERRGGPTVRTDGWLALDAVRVIRATAGA